MGCIGVIGAKQIKQSGYGGVLSSAMSLEVRSSALGAALRYFSADGTSCLTVSVVPSVSSPPNLRPRRGRGFLVLSAPAVCAGVLVPPPPFERGASEGVPAGLPPWFLGLRGSLEPSSLDRP